MAFPRALRLVRDTAMVADAIATTMAEPTHVREASSQLLDAIAGTYGSRVGRSTAMRVPAFARALKLYTHTIAAFPLTEYVGAARVPPRSFLDNPFAGSTTYTAGMTRTIADLLCNDVAYWWVRSRTWDGWPVAVSYLPADEVTVTPADDPAGFPNGDYVWNGRTLPGRDVIRFDGDGTGGWLTSGVDAITTAAALEAAVLRSAEVPSPSVILKNTGADLPPDQVDALLTAWETARANRSTAYLNATLQTESLGGWSPNDLQLVEARNAAATMIARIANLDPVWVGAGVPGSSLTYTNRQDLYRQLVDLSLTTPMRFVTERLSAPDVTPRGHTVEFDTDVFLRANTTDLAAVINLMHPLGVVTTDEARTLLDLNDVEA